jgi:hypothetical protein
MIYMREKFVLHVMALGHKLCTTVQTTTLTLPFANTSDPIACSMLSVIIIINIAVCYAEIRIYHMCAML